MSKAKLHVTKIIVERKFVGTQSVSDAFIPIIYEDLLKKLEQHRTLDNNYDTI